MKTDSITGAADARFQAPHPYNKQLNIACLYATPQRTRNMEESLCNVEFLKTDSSYLARVQSELGGLREYKSGSFEEVLEQVIIDLQEEFES